VDGGLVADGELVIAGGDGPVAFEPVDAAFDGVTLLVDVAVERGWPATAPASPLAVGDAVALFGDGAFDTALAQPGPVGAGPVGLVTQDPVRSAAGPARAQAWYRNLVQDGGELGAVATLPGGDHDGQGFLALLNGQVDFGGQATAGPAQPMISEFVLDPARWLGLQIPLLRAPAAC
jgi:hypothetical protein